MIFFCCDSCVDVVSLCNILSSCSPFALIAKSSFSEETSCGESETSDFVWRFLSLHEFNIKVVHYSPNYCRVKRNAVSVIGYKVYNANITMEFDIVISIAFFLLRLLFLKRVNLIITGIVQ